MEPSGDGLSAARHTFIGDAHTMNSNHTQDALQDMTNEDLAELAGGDSLAGDVARFAGMLVGNAILAAKVDWYLITNRPFVYLEGQGLKT